MRFLIGLAVVAGVGFLAAADDKKGGTKLSGTWTREADGFTVRMAFKPETLTLTVASGENSVTATAKYTVDKDGKVKGTITGGEKKGDFPEPKVGSEFAFTFKVDGKKAKLDDFKADEAEHAKPIMEGEYESKAD